MPGEDIAQGVPAALAKFSPVTGALDAAQSGGQQLLDLLMQLFQQQQQPPPPPLPFAGQPQSQGQGGLKGKILGEY